MEDDLPPPLRVRSINKSVATAAGEHRKKTFQRRALGSGPQRLDSSTDESPEHFLLALTVDAQTLGPARRFRTSEPPPGSINVEQTRLQSVGQETRCPSQDGSGRHPTNGDNDPEQPLTWLFLSPPSAGVPALESSSPVHDANDPIVPVPAPCLESPGCC